MTREAERAKRRQLELAVNGVKRHTLPPSVAEAARGWIELGVAVAPTTLETCRALKGVGQEMNGMLACDIQARDIAACQRKRTEQGAAPATVNKQVACVHGAHALAFANVRKSNAAERRASEWQIPNPPECEI